VKSWRVELLSLSDFEAQGGSAEDQERAFNRFIDLVDMVDGADPDLVVQTLLDALSDQEDYGAWETVIRAFMRIPAERRGRQIARGFARLLDRAPVTAGDVLGQLAMSGSEAADAFNQEMKATASAEDRYAVQKFVDDNELGDGWLSNDRVRGRIRVA
jgi:hypothetical protein